MDRLYKEQLDPRSSPSLSAAGHPPLPIPGKDERFPLFNLVYLFIIFLAALQRHVGFPDQGSNPCPLHWKGGVLTTGPPGKFQEVSLKVGTRGPRPTDPSLTRAAGHALKTGNLQECLFMEQ